MPQGNIEHKGNNTALNAASTAAANASTPKPTIPNKQDYQAKVRELNDQLRKFGRGGMVVMTDGIATCDRQTITSIFAAVAAFDAFTEDNDPWGEHDCAILTVAGERIMFKIDYFDKDRTYHSPNPADPKVTTRIMTVMQADEY